MKKINFNRILLVYDEGGLVDAVMLDVNERWNKKALRKALSMVGFDDESNGEETIDEIVDALLKYKTYLYKDVMRLFTINGIS